MRKPIPQPNRPGFTLLELIIASALVAVLMGAVWSILGVYGDLFEQGQERTEEVQLIRTLSQQLSEDLQGAIQDPVFVDPQSAGPTGARRFGLYGTTTDLRIDVLQIPAFEVAPTPTAREMEDTSRPRKLQAPELRTVYYAFRGSALNDPDDLAAGAGLTRRELDFETPDAPGDGVSGADGGPAVLEGAVMTAASGSAARKEEPAMAPASSTFEQILREGADNALTWAPEVVALQFRYFDGSAWRSSWDSLARQGLPVAVEMTLAVTSLEGSERFRRVVSGGTASAGAPAGTVGAFGGQGAAPPREKAPEPRIHRVVVHVPNSPLYKPPQEIRRRAAPALKAPAPLPKLILTQPQTRRPAARAAPDQWIRNE